MFKGTQGNIIFFSQYCITSDT